MGRTQIFKGKVMVKRSVVAMCIEFVLVGCSTSNSSNQVQTLTVGLSSEMNGDFSPLYYRTLNDNSVVSLVYQGLLKYDKDQNLVLIWLVNYH